MDSFAKISSNPLSWAKSWKEEHRKKAVGHLPMYAPEELIDAAGMLPVALQGMDAEVVLANAHLHSNLCHPMRSNFEAALRGDLDFLDGLVFCDNCDQSKRLGNLWELYHKPAFTFHLRLPKRLDTEEAKLFYVAELRRFRSALEKFAGRKISDQDIRRSIGTYNEVRKLLSRIHELRRETPALFGAEEVAAITNAAMVMPKQELRQMLLSCIREKEKAPVAQRSGVRLLVCGNPCEDMEPGLLDMIAAAGGVIVEDYVYPGSMYLTHQAVSETGDPIEALALAYMNSSPCPTKYKPDKDWGNHILNLAKETKADGIVIVAPMYCEIYGFEYPDAEANLSKAGIPSLNLEVAHSGADGRMRTRIEAFVEMLEARKESR